MLLYLILFAFAYTYFFYKKKHSYYKNVLGLSGPKPFLFFGNNLNYFFDTFANYEKDNFKKYGRTYVDFLFDNDGCIITSNPDYVKKILIKDFHNFSTRFPNIDNEKYVRKAVIFQDEDWKRIRTQITPVFTSGRLKLMVKKFKHPVNNVISKLNEQIELGLGNKVEVKMLSRCFALDIIANVVFSLETNSHKGDKFSQKITNLFRISRFDPLLEFILPSFIHKMKIFSSVNELETEYFVKLATNLIEERKNNKNSMYNDFVELLLKSEAENEILNNSDNSGRIIKKLTLEEIIGQCISFFAAGIETISIISISFLYELALHPDVQEKLYQDIIKNYPDDELNYENLNNSKYLDCVLNEVLRLHVTLNRIFRRSANDYDFGEFKIKKNQAVGISIYNLHHDPEIYEDPYEFKPERFENKDFISEHVFIPFSNGPRNCIGNRLAIFEMKYFIISIIKKYKVLRTEFTKVPLVEEKFVNFGTYKDTYLGFEKRE